MRGRAAWYGILGAGVAAWLLIPKRASAAEALAPLPPEGREPVEPDEGQIAPPPATGGYAPDPELGGGTPRPGAPPAGTQPIESPPVTGPVYRTPAGWPIVQGATYKAHLEIAAPGWLVSCAKVRSELEEAGFRVISCMRTVGTNFNLVARRTGASGTFTEPDRVTVHSLERTA